MDQGEALLFPEPDLGKALSFWDLWHGFAHVNNPYHSEHHVLPHMTM